jgi:hypothetical protein
LFTWNSSWQAAYYWDVLRWLRENVHRLHPEIWQRKNWLLHYNTPSAISIFTREFVTKNNMTVIPHLPYFPDLAPATFLFPRLKIKLKGHHFDNSWVTEAESQAVLNPLTEHDFQDVFKKWQKRWEQCIHAEGDYFKGDSGQ